MPRAPNYPMKFPANLWAEYEALCAHFKQPPGATLQLHARDTIGHPNRICRGVAAAYKRRAEHGDMIVKASRWPQGLLEEISAEAAKMHMGRELYLRLVIEGILAEFREKHPDYAHVVDAVKDENS